MGQRDWAGKPWETARVCLRHTKRPFSTHPGLYISVPRPWKRVREAGEIARLLLLQLDSGLPPLAGSEQKGEADLGRMTVREGTKDGGSPGRPHQEGEGWEGRCTDPGRRAASSWKGGRPAWLDKWQQLEVFPENSAK